MDEKRTTRICKDCRAQGITKIRACPYPGPRCATHHRQFKTAQRARNHDRHVQVTYGLAPGEYDLLCAFQDGLCAICRRARCTGRSGKKLAVDHNHDTGAPRGLTCVNCNRFLLGRYDIPALERAIAYLRFPPYAQLLAFGLRPQARPEMPFRETDVYEIRRLLSEETS